MSSALCSNMYCVLNMGRSLINPLECQVLYPLRSVTFAWTSVISVDFHDCRFTAEEVWFKWFWIIQSSSSDQFLLQLLQGIYLILVFLIAIPNLFACYSLIHLDFSIVLSIALELNWSLLGLCCDITVCKHPNIIYDLLSDPAFMSRNCVSGANLICLMIFASMIELFRTTPITMVTIHSLTGPRMFLDLLLWHASRLIY